MRITGASSHECPTCHGLGYTQACQAEMVTSLIRDFGYVETATRRGIDGRALVGSGCLRCGGTGQLDKRYDVD